MRLRIFLKLENKTINSNYKHHLQSLVYNMLGGDKKFNDLHDVGYRLENRPFKMFVISDIIGSFDYLNDNKILKFKTNGYFEVSSFDEDIAIKIVEYLSFNNSIFLGKSIIKHNGYKIVFLIII